jgi:hypothetical protein
MRAKSKTKKPAKKPIKAKVSPASKGLLLMLEGLGDEKTAAMDAIHLRLAEMKKFIDVAIAGAEGELKEVLTALRAFLF